MDRKNMVEVERAYKTYGNLNVLRSLNMTVPKGCIYSLLGPSGCGKTTMLSCIVGQKKLDFGQITLGVKKKKQIGYMPQEIGLFLEFRIEEIFHYFGRIFGMDSESVAHREKQLKKILELPSKKREVRTLSGGQQRRVSMALTLLHDPELIIFDEPTVGLDPILAHNAWNYFVHLTSNEGKTILITTHYIEEARQSNVIALMRNGTLLVESSPVDLMNQHNSTSLEEIFLEFSKKQEYVNEPGVRRESDYMTLTRLKKQKNAPLTSEGRFKINRFYAQVYKNFMGIYRNKQLMLFLIILPLIQSCVFDAAYGNEPRRIPIAVVTDGVVTSHHCYEIRDNHTYNDFLECNIPLSLPCRYIDHLGSNSEIHQYPDLKTAKRAVAKNQAWALIHMQHNFSEAFIERLRLGFDSNDLILDQSIISVWLDMSDYVYAQILRRHLYNGLHEFLKEILELCGVNTALAGEPIRFKEITFNPGMSSFARTGLPGYLCAFVFYWPVVFTSGAILMEKESGVLDRTIASGLTTIELLMAQFVVQLIVSTGQNGLMMIIFYYLSCHEIAGDIGSAILVLYVVTIIGTALGFLFGEMMSKSSHITYASLGLVLTILTTSGYIWPREGGHFLVTVWSKYFPVVSAIESYANVALRGHTIFQFSVYFGILLSLFWTTVFFILSYIFHKRHM